LAKASKSDHDPAPPLLKVSGLQASIGGYHILHGVDLTVPENATLAVLGRNGAGKTTTLRSIMGFVGDLPVGSIEFKGERLDGLATHVIARRGLGFVPEDRGLFPFLTVEENLRVPTSTPRMWDYVMTLFPVLKDKLKQQAGLLSGGQQQMLSIGRALIQEPELLLLDEPCQGLAPLLIDELLEQLRQLGEHMTIVLVEQNIEVARRLADAFVVLDDGQSVMHGTINDLDTRMGEIEHYLAVPAL
jgi:branched-chain amino acid transport system ATP-binding protein